MQTLTDSSNKIIPIVDLDPRKVFKEAFIGLYGAPETPYRLVVEGVSSSVIVGEYATAQEALDASLAYGTLVCHWFVRGKRNR